jgi:transposase, IS5 family
MDLVNLIDDRHELVELASLIDWPAFEQAWGPRCWRRRIGEEGCEGLLEHSIMAAMSAGVVKRQRLDTVIVDTTVQPKAIAHPTDSRLLNRAREQLVAAAQAGRYAHAQQWLRMRREVKKLRMWLGRVIRDVQRKAGEITGTLKTCIETAQRLHAQQRDSKNKLYALHAPEVECLALGLVPGRRTSSA